MQRILIVGAALSAARLRAEQGVSPDALEIAVVAPEPRLVIRPRLYERAPETMVAPLAELFDAVDVRYEQGQVDVIDSASQSVVIVGSDGIARSGGITSKRASVRPHGERKRFPITCDQETL